MEDEVQHSRLEPFANFAELEMLCWALEFVKSTLVSQKLAKCIPSLVQVSTLSAVSRANSERSKPLTFNEKMRKRFPGSSKIKLPIRPGRAGDSAETGGAP